MFIKTLDVFSVSLPLCRPVFYAGRWWDCLETLIVRLGDGARFGYAEIPVTCSPDVDLPRLRKELLEEFAPKLCGNGAANARELAELLEGLAERPFTFAAIEIAWWDLAAREKNIPLYEMLGADPVAQELFTSVDRPPGEFENLDRDGFLQDIAELYEKGYAHLELKIRPGWDRAMLHAVRMRVPAQSLHIDAEAGLRSHHMLSVCQVQDFLPWMFEQPLAIDDFVGHYNLRDIIHIPIGMDESITSVNAAQTALWIQSAHCLKINPVRVGGLAAAKEIIALCREKEVSAWISAPLQTAVGAAVALAVSCLEGVTGPFEYYDPARWFTDAERLPVLPTVELDEDDLLRITPDQSPGIGVDWPAECANPD